MDIKRILKSNMSEIDKQIKLYNFIMYSMKTSNLDELLSLDDFTIDYGTEEILKYAFDYASYEILKFLLLHVNNEQKIIKSNIIEPIIYIYCVYNNKQCYEILDFMISKYSNRIIYYIYDLAINKGYRDIEPLYKLLIMNGCDINKILDLKLKNKILNQIRQEKLRKICI